MLPFPSADCLLSSSAFGAENYASVDKKIKKINILTTAYKKLQLSNPFMPAPNELDWLMVKRTKSFCCEDELDRSVSTAVPVVDGVVPSARDEDVWVTRVKDACKHAIAMSVLTFEVAAVTRTRMLPHTALLFHTVGYLSSSWLCLCQCEK